MSSPGITRRSAGGFNWTIGNSLFWQKERRYASFCSVWDVKPTLFSMQVVNKVFTFTPRLFFSLLSFFYDLPQQDFQDRRIREYAGLLPGLNLKFSQNLFGRNRRKVTNRHINDCPFWQGCWHLLVSKFIWKQESCQNSGFPLTCSSMFSYITHVTILLLQFS